VPEKIPPGTVGGVRPYVVHPDSRALNLVGLVPPPDVVSGGENLNIVENEHVTEPVPNVFLVTAEAELGTRVTRHTTVVVATTQQRKGRSNTRWVLIRHR